MSQVKTNSSRGVGKKRSYGKKYVTKREMYKAIHKNIENKIAYGTMVSHFNSIGSTWNEQVFNKIEQGTVLNKRIGNVITIRSIEFNGVITGGASGTFVDDVYNMVRIVIALWDGNDDTPLLTASWSSDYPLRKSLSPTASTLIKKLYDKYIPLPAQGYDGTEGVIPGVRKFKYYKYFKKGVKVTFSDNTKDYPDKRLILSAISDSSLAPSPGFISGYWVITYEDA